MGFCVLIGIKKIKKINKNMKWNNIVFFKDIELICDKKMNNLLKIILGFISFF